MRNNSIILILIIISIVVILIAAYFLGKKSAIKESQTSPLEIPQEIDLKKPVEEYREPFRTGSEKKTVNDVLEYFGEEVRNKLMPYFTQANIPYPPKKLTFLAMKEEHVIELWASNDKNQYVFIRSYEIKKLSGINGPKLREGDRQVPEGIYKITSFNPNSSYHLSMKLNYPNQFDLLHAKEEDRAEPGTNIFIHGSAMSIGCLAMGDKTIEELFVLSKDVGIKNISFVISPYDPRVKELTYDKNSQPEWISELYLNVENEFSRLIKPTK